MLCYELTNPGGLFPLTSEISYIQTLGKSHERKCAAAAPKDVFIHWIPGFRSIIAQTHDHLPAYVK